MRNPLDFKIRCSAIGKIMSNSKKPGELSQVCKTYLQEWYANDNEEIRSKYLTKGIMVENDLIDFATEQLGYGIATKNIIQRSDEYFMGTCDVEYPDAICDVKAPWNRKTFYDQVLAGLDKDYEYQLIGYCHLWSKPKGILFFGLMDTPPEANNDSEVIYEDLPPNERWIAYTVTPTTEVIESIVERVVACREYLVEYDKLIKSKLGHVL